MPDAFPDGHPRIMPDDDAECLIPHMKVMYCTRLCSKTIELQVVAAVSYVTSR